MKKYFSLMKTLQELLKHDAQAGEVMDCLVENKNHHEMNEKCKAGIEHHQLVSELLLRVCCSNLNIWLIILLPPFDWNFL